MSYERYSPTGFGFLPPVVKNLLIINVLFFLATIVLGNTMNLDLTDMLGLHYFAATKFEPYQFITYMFMHSNFSHIFFNMFALWMFGSVLEQVWEPKIPSLLHYYRYRRCAGTLHGFLFPGFHLPLKHGCICSKPDLANLQQFISQLQFNLANGSPEFEQAFQNFKQSFATLQMEPGNMQAMQEAINFVTLYREHFLNLPVVVGASGAIYGLLLAFGMLFPNSLIYLYFFIPMKAKWFVIIFGAIELFSGFYNQNSGVAHFAHLGGMIFGFFLILYWKKKADRHHHNYYQ
ncbi:MAG: rhomboid family intramembrane serine protease [Bacteroidales bacterium]